MSVIKIRAALETALNGMTPALETAWENVPFTPVTCTPYQQVNLLFANPFNPEMGPLQQQSGYMQVMLLYPIDTGTAAINARAELIKATFPRAATFTSGGVIVTIEKTPEIAPGRVDVDRYAIPVKIRFYSNIL